MQVQTEKGVWIVPPQRAVWVPGKIVHSIRMPGAVSMRTLYFARRYVKGLPRRCFVFSVSPLLRELILHVCQRERLSNKVAREKNALAMIVNQLVTAAVEPLELPMPVDERAKRMAERLLTDPSDQNQLEEVCKECGASKRTIERLFLAETNMTVGKWRQQLRLLHSLPMLASGEKVINVALSAGYNSPSAFVSAFRKVLGTTPSRYCGD